MIQLLAKAPKYFLILYDFQIIILLCKINNKIIKNNTNNKNLLILSTMGLLLIVIFDRSYYSYNLVEKMEIVGTKYLFRLKGNKKKVQYINENSLNDYSFMNKKINNRIVKTLMKIIIC